MCNRSSAYLIACGNKIDHSYIQERLQAKPIKEEGTGYKIVRVPIYKDGRNLTVKPMVAYPPVPINEWMEWDGGKLRPGDGFCFFTNKKEAKRALHLWCCDTDHTKASYIILKVKYKGGIESRLEYYMVIGKAIRVALCTKLYITEEKV